MTAMAFDDALAHVVGCIVRLPPMRLSLAEARGFVLAEDVVARIASPQRDLSAMDGFAVRDIDLNDERAWLPVSGKTFPGDGDPPPLPPGTAMAVHTGSPLPRDADRVVMLEHVDRTDTAIRPNGPVGDGRHIRRRGSEFARGTTVLEADTILNPRTLVVAAAADVAQVAVTRRPRVAILATGDELVAGGRAWLRVENTPDSISIGLAALVADWGGGDVVCQRVADTQDALRRAMLEAVREADCVIVIAGASVGERDHARTVLRQLGGDTRFAGVAMKPGKPSWLGMVQGKPVVGLPGNPTAAMVTARLFVAPMIAGMAGRGWQAATKWQRRLLIGATLADSPVDFFARAQLEDGKVRLLDVQQASAQRSLADADVIVRLRPGRADAGDGVEALPF